MASIIHSQDNIFSIEEQVLEYNIIYLADLCWKEWYKGNSCGKGKAVYKE